jgi:hypothetical protein
VVEHGLDFREKVAVGDKLLILLERAPRCKCGRDCEFLQYFDRMIPMQYTNQEAWQT